MTLNSLILLPPHSKLPGVCHLLISYFLVINKMKWPAWSVQFQTSQGYTVRTCVQKKKRGEQLESSVVKNSGRSSKGLGFDSQHPYGNSQLSVIQVLGLWPPQVPGTHMVHICRSNTCTKSEIIYMFLKTGSICVART